MPPLQRVESNWLRVDRKATADRSQLKADASPQCYQPSTFFLPDAHALIRWHEHFVGRLYFERLIPGVNISGWADHAKLAGRVGIAYDLLFDVIVGNFSAPSLGPPEKYALLTGVTVEDWSLLSFE